MATKGHLLSMSYHLPLPSLYKPLFPSFLISYFSFPVSESPSPSQFDILKTQPMEKTRGAHSFRPRVGQSSTPPASTSTPGAAAVAAVAVGPNEAVSRPPAAAAASPALAAVQGAAAADAEGSSSVAPAQRRYHT